jgi:predicted DNA-binding transcriptional regulator AlpA
MNTAATNPDYATEDDLHAYWRTPSRRAARELARSLGIRLVRGGYPWPSVWAAEGLAVPPKNRWNELKLPHLTAEDLAKVLGESTRSARRRDCSKPDANFPDPVRLREKPKLWRSAQVNAWQAGLPVPAYKAVSNKRREIEAATRSSQIEESRSAIYNPFAEARSAAKAND